MLFFSRGPCSPKAAIFFSCHDSANRSLSFSHACRMLMSSQFPNIIWLGKKVQTTLCNCAGDGEAVSALGSPRHHPRLPVGGASYIKQNFLCACLLTYQLQSATKRLADAKCTNRQGRATMAAFAKKL